MNKTPRVFFITDKNPVYKRFACYIWFVGWDCISFGVSVCFSMPNMEIHLPFCFIKIGWNTTYRGIPLDQQGSNIWRLFDLKNRLRKFLTFS